ncbi:MAG TPA: hypothetical protein VNY05_36095 [Candidatus Acidoferrales bacterium]|nr:hypothetical protein [Candidatus Acidoferrales bacterium]
MPKRTFAAAILCVCVCGAVREAYASEADAVAISAAIRARHFPFGTILDPIYTSPTSTQIVGYTRCGDSALWTGAYLAAEAFRYKVTQSADALNNVKAALAGLKGLVDVTGDNRLARCMALAASPYAAGIQNEEVNNTIHQNPPWIWVDNTSRDEVVGAFFGLGAAFDVVDDAAVKSGISDLATRMAGFIASHQWSPNDDISNTFLLRPEELQMLLQVARHVNPANTIGGPFLALPVNVGVLVDVNDNSSYFKFNLDYMTFYNLIRLQSNGDNRAAYQIVRDFTASHQNAFFDVIDRVIRGPDPTRDAEMASLLDQWLLRPNRDFGVDLTKSVQVCGSEACQPIPVPLRVPTDFLWQRDPFQLAGGGSGRVESPGIDYILPYWMGRYYGVIAGSAVQSAAAPTAAVAPDSLASLFGANLAAGTVQATSLPLQTTLGGVTLTVTDAAGVPRKAPLIYVSPGQINFEVPDGTAPGQAVFAVSNAATPQTFTGAVQPIAPALFSMNGAGTGVAAAIAIAVQASNPQLQSPVPVFQCGSAGGGSGCAAVPIVLGVDTPVYVSFYGTGIRNASSLAKVQVTINGMSVPVLYAGPAPNYTGLDQVNAALVLGLRGSGETSVILTVDGQVSNVVTISVQ